MVYIRSKYTVNKFAFALIATFVVIMFVVTKYYNKPNEISWLSSPPNLVDDETISLCENLLRELVELSSQELNPLLGDFDSEGTAINDKFMRKCIKFQVGVYEDAVNPKNTFQFLLEANFAHAEYIYQDISNNIVVLGGRF